MPPPGIAKLGEFIRDLERGKQITVKRCDFVKVIEEYNRLKMKYEDLQYDYERLKSIPPEPKP